MGTKGGRPQRPLDYQRPVDKQIGKGYSNQMNDLFVRINLLEDSCATKGALALAPPLEFEFDSNMLQRLYSKKAH